MGQRSSNFTFQEAKLPTPDTQTHMIQFNCFFFLTQRRNAATLRAKHYLCVRHYSLHVIWCVLFANYFGSLGIRMVTSDGLHTCHCLYSVPQPA